MTLVLGMSKPEGIYLSVDYRLTDSRSSRPISDEATKVLMVKYPPIPGGPHALFAFTGVAESKDGTPTVKWIRETIRGEVEPINRSIDHLHDRLNRDYGPVGQPLVVLGLVLHGERRFFVEMTNLAPVPDGFVITPEFVLGKVELHEPMSIAAGSGARSAGPEQDRLRPHLTTRPRDPMNHMNMLAQANRRIARTEPSVSPFCQVGFVGDAWFSPRLHVFTEPGESVPFEMPSVLFGIDLTDSIRGLTERFVQGAEAADSDSLESPRVDRKT